MSSLISLHHFDLAGLDVECDAIEPDAVGRFIGIGPRMPDRLAVGLHDIPVAQDITVDLRGNRAVRSMDPGIKFCPAR